MEHVITTLLARDPDNRYPDAAALVRALGALAAGGTAPAGSASGDGPVPTADPQWMVDPTEAAGGGWDGPGLHDSPDDGQDDADGNADDDAGDYADDDAEDDAGDDWDGHQGIDAVRRRRRTGHVVIALLVVAVLALIVALVNDTGAAGLLSGQ
jgi:hypothetical protein